MEIPDLIKQRLGEESLESAVSLGDEDLICFTPTRSLLYRGEGLIGDESVDVYDSNVERLNVSEGRRKTSFTLSYVDREESFSVASDRGDAVLQRLLQSVLRTGDVLDPEESVNDVYLFSELTIIITDGRLVKHIGAYVWDADYEEYPFDEVTGLDFEEGSVATQIVLAVAGRPQRFKAPSDEAKLLRRSLTNALCEYHDVGSLAQLQTALEQKAPEESTDEAVSSDIELDDSISPLVGDDEETELDGAVREIGETRAEAAADADDEAATADAATGDEQPDAGENEAATAETTDGEQTTESGSESTATRAGGATASGQAADASGVDAEEIEAMQTQLSNLTTAVKRQNDLLKEQHETIRKLIDELQRRE